MIINMKDLECLAWMVKFLVLGGIVSLIFGYYAGHVL